MTSSQPTIASTGPRVRTFVTSPVAVQAILINQAEEILLLNSPSRKQGWQLVSGALEANETVLDGTIREIHEELGAGVHIRPLGTVHVETFRFDKNIPFMLSIYTLFAFDKGVIVPSDDMAGSEIRWWTLADLDQSGAQFHATAKLWMFNRAVDLYRLWIDSPPAPLQPNL